jgi:50S ribosomal protein L16 3-hydroxylase
MAMFGSDISYEEFLRDYWQKKPLLFRQAFPDINSSLSVEELAGLACIDGINSRLIFESAEYSPDGRAWSVRHGPFDENDFAHLPENGWSLLVSDVEKHVPAANELIDAFRFIPDWRIDDLMISFAPPGASVGAHVDAYDVFLLQLQGTRHWMISESFDSAELANTDLRILKSFTAEQSWDLQAGDMLYLPPNVAHHGIAKNDCMTASIGFRAPELRSLISDFGEYLARRLPEDARYSDPDLTLQAHPAELTPQTISRLKKIMQDCISTDDETILNWIGEYASDNRISSQLYENDQTFSDFAKLKKAIEQDLPLEHNPMSRFLFSRSSDQALLFVDGHSYPCSIKLAENLCAHSLIDSDALLASIQDTRDESVLLELCHKQSLLVDNE